MHLKAGRYQLIATHVYWSNVFKRVCLLIEMGFLPFRVDLKRPFRYSGPIIHGARPDEDELYYRGRKARRSRNPSPPGAMYAR